MVGSLLTAAMCFVFADNLHDRMSTDMYIRVSIGLEEGAGEDAGDGIGAYGSYI